MNLFRRAPFHPFLLAGYPVLALLAHNMGQVYPWMAARSLVLSLLGACLLLIILRLMIGDWQKAALMVSLVVLMALTYGHIYSLIENTTLFWFNIGRHRFLMGGMGLLLAALLTWLVRDTVLLRKKGSPGVLDRLRPLTQALNVITILLTAFALAQIAWYTIQNTAPAAQPGANHNYDLSGMEGLSTLRLPDSNDGQSGLPPDVYYIILDAYGRDDTLKDFFDYDNSSFLMSLEEMGFFVARCSQSNYSRTELSLSSSLSMNYIDALGVDASSSSVLAELIIHSAVRQSFERLGYNTIAFESGYSSTEWRDADVYLSPNLHPGKANYLGGINIFEALLLRTSIGILVYEKFDALPDRIKTQLSATYAEHRGRILYTLDELEKIPALPGSKLVFAHLLVPHEPFVFGPDGEFIIRKTPFTLNHDPESRDPALYSIGYTNQLIYINSRLESLVRKILAESETPPIIILQGDHGPLFRVTSPAARMTNLIAIYLPPEGVVYHPDSVTLYDSITPVNIFRLILDGYFGAKLGLVEDVSYFSRESDTFTEVPNTRTDCRP